MAAWEYFHVSIIGEHTSLSSAQNMFVSTSDRRLWGTRMPADPMAFLNRMGGEGWEMVRVDGSPDGSSIAAWFKRQR